jgi:hypothetical protein
LGIGENMAISQKEWSKETKRNIALSAGVLIAAVIFFSLI